ncbi:MAG: hypothetical protein WCX31_10420 [Salinivirgaceae bacterium]|jgi:hypothetical protein
MIKKLFFITTIILFWSACQKPDLEPIPVVYNYSYFPMDSGAWREFEVTKIVIDKPSNVFDTTHYYLLEQWVGLIVSASNDSMIRLERFSKIKQNHTWEILSVWQSGIINHEAIQVEENIRYLKLDFPVQLNKAWDGNRYNRLDTLNQYSYKIITINEPYSLNNLLFDSVLTVVQKEKLTKIDKIYFEEKYALGVGLIEKQQTDIYSGEKEYDPNIPVEERITRGIIYNQKLIGYGNK